MYPDDLTVFMYESESWIVGDDLWPTRSKDADRLPTRYRQNMNKLLH